MVDQGIDDSQYKIKDFLDLLPCQLNIERQMVDYAVPSLNELVKPGFKERQPLTNSLAFTEKLPEVNSKPV